MTQPMSPTPSSTPAIRALRGSADALQIEWSDGLNQRITWRTLRDRCPCAHCKADRRQPASLNPLAILQPGEAAPLRVTSMRPVGNYAYAIDFSDGHASGIYALEYLREVGASTGS